MSEAEDYHILAAVEMKITQAFLRLQEAHRLINFYKKKRGFEIKELNDLLPADPDVNGTRAQIEAEECIS